MKNPKFLFVAAAILPLCIYACGGGRGSSNSSSSDDTHDNPSNGGDTTVECVVNADCSDGAQFCYFGTCKDWDEVGIDTGTSCEVEGDCSGGATCAKIDASEGCPGYCLDVSTFTDGLNYPSTESACDDATGAEWADLGDGVCLTRDIYECISVDDDTAVCNDNLVSASNGCFEQTSESACNNSYQPYFDTDGDETYYTYHNCIWNDESGVCNIQGSSVDEYTCVGGDGGYPPSWQNLLGTFEYRGETDSEACTPKPNDEFYDEFVISSMMTLKFTEFFITYVFATYNAESGIATQTGYTEGFGGFKIKTYLEDGEIKLIFVDSVGAVNYRCDEGSAGPVYILE
jgi:hypothetical protein